MRASLDAPARVRLFAAVATLFVHLAAIGAAIGWSEYRNPVAAAADRHLTVVSIHKVTPSQSQPKAAADLRGNISRKIGGEPAQPLPPANVQGTAAAHSGPSDAPAPLVVPRPPDAASAQTGRPHDAAPAQMDAYKMLLWRQIAARRPRGMQVSGSALVRFRLGMDGALLSAEIFQSSGNVNLDRIALRTVRQASPFPKPPASLANDDMVFTIPINFH